MWWHHVLSFFGIVNEAGPGYGYWSGVGSDVTQLSIVAIIYRRFNCHAAHCFRLGLHRVDGTHFVTCRKHHPHHAGPAPATAEQIAEAARLSQLRRQGDAV